MGLLDRFRAILKRNKAESSARGTQVHQRFGRIWTDADREQVMADCDNGQFYKLGQLLDAMRGDGKIRGLLHTRTAGMLSLPVMFEGDTTAIESLKGIPEHEDPTTGLVLPHVPGAWNYIVPKSELTLMLSDGIMAGVAVGYLCDDHSTSRPAWRKLKHLTIYHLRYQHSTDEWFYMDRERGMIKITPGDGRWVLFTPYGSSRPWVYGAWNACARGFVTKDGARCDQDRWANTLADALRYIETGKSASDPMFQEYLRFVRYHWNHAPGVVLAEGDKAGVVESSGQGYQVYTQQWEQANEEITIALAGQMVTTEGGKGFSSGDIWRNIDSDLIQAVADAAGECVSEQILDPFTEWAGLGRGIVRASWNVREQAQKLAKAEASKAAADALKSLDEVAKERGKRAKMETFLNAIGVEIEFEDVAPVLPENPVLPQLPAATATEEEQEGEASPDAAELLAVKMTQHRIERCRHDKVNRCRLCGIERANDFEVGPDGTPQWKVLWRPIQTTSV